MASARDIRDPKSDLLLTPQNAALLIIDYQPTQVASVASRDKRSLVANVVALARTAKLFGLPVVLSTVNVNTNINKPTIHQITDVLSDVEPIDRTSINAWEDDDFVRAVRATERRKLLIAALWTEVCLVFPALDALHAGYEVFPVVDAVGGTSVEAHDLAVERLIQAGAQPTSWVQVICELQRDWNRTQTAAAFANILFAVEGA
jgi:nicotinamidase-related amidase